MELTTSIVINCSQSAVWQAISDIENASTMITAIRDLEILERPEAGLIGLKWRESREMYGKASSETMWITEAIDGQSYHTRAENHGAIYRSCLSIDTHAQGCKLSMRFSSEAQTLFAKIMSTLMAKLIKGSISKMLEKDLRDIKHFVEAQAQ